MLALVNQLRVFSIFCVMTSTFPSRDGIGQSDTVAYQTDPQGFFILFFMFPIQKTKSYPLWSLQSSKKCDRNQFTDTIGLPNHIRSIYFYLIAISHKISKRPLWETYKTTKSNRYKKSKQSNA